MPASSNFSEILARRPALLATLLGLIAFLSVVVALDAAGDFPGWTEGPGLTIDESFNVQQGVRLAVAGKAWLLGAMTWQEVFGGPEQLGPNAPMGYHLPDHPPLGRWWLGFWHQWTLSVAPPKNPDGPFVTAAARVGSAVAFGLTVFLATWCAGRWYGVFPSVVTAMSLVAMPRVFGHAHLASLETTIGLASFAALFVVAERWHGDQPPTFRDVVIAGFFLGLALLTKIQAIFLPPAVVLWAFWRWRGKSVTPLAVWGLTGLLVFFLLWPWLWFDPWNHFLQYLGRTTNRASLNVYYLGTVFADRDSPWHYPWVMFLATVPAPVLLLGAFGCWRRSPGVVPSTANQKPTTETEDRFPPREALLLLVIVIPLIVFSIPGVAVYDGARLFLVVFPPWAVLCGRGARWLLERVLRRSTESTRTRRAAAAIAATLALLAVSLGSLWRIAPCYLSGYSSLVGNLPGADRLGLEQNYWGDSVTRTFLAQVVDAVPKGAKVAVSPVLHQFQLPEMLAQSPILRDHGIRLTAYDPETPADYLIRFERRADCPSELETELPKAERLATIEREGVILAGLYRLTSQSVR